MKKCLECGSYDVHDIELRKDDTYSITPVNISSIREISDDDLPTRISGCYCHVCQSLVKISTENDSAAIAENECPASSLSGKKKFLVLIDSSFVRDAQVLPEEFFINQGDNVDDCDSAWKDWQGAIVVGVYPGCCINSAIMKAADEENINPGKLIAYEIVE